MLYTGDFPLYYYVRFLQIRSHLIDKTGELPIPTEHSWTVFVRSYSDDFSGSSSGIATSVCQDIRGHQLLAKEHLLAGVPKYVANT